MSYFLSGLARARFGGARVVLLLAFGFTWSDLDGQNLLPSEGAKAQNSCAAADDLCRLLV